MNLPTYLERSRRFDVAVWAVVPLFVIYELGLILFEAGSVRNGADALLRTHLHLQSPRALLGLNALVLGLLVLVVGWRGRGEGVRSFRVFLLLLVECLLWAVLLTPFTALLGDLARLEIGGAVRGRLIDCVYGAGAGLYEELVFRLLLVGGGTLLLERVLRADPIWARALSVLVAAAAFSAFHHVGPYGEVVEIEAVVFRFLAGVLLGVLFLYRGFAVPVWTHAIYDILLALGLAL